MTKVMSSQVVRKASHRARLFDSSTSLASWVAQFVHGGLSRGEGVLLVLRARNWSRALELLVRQGTDVVKAVVEGRLMVFDAQELLSECAPAGRVDPAAFKAAVSDLVGRMAARGPLRIYGEMVDLLAVEGRFEEVDRLEALWNGLAKQIPFCLVCGYSALLFGNQRSADELRHIACAHNGMQANLSDRLSHALVERLELEQEHVEVDPTRVPERPGAPEPLGYAARGTH